MPRPKPLKPKIAVQFYADEELWRLAKAAIDESGMTYSGAISRLLALLVSTPEAKRSALLRVSPDKVIKGTKAK